MLRQGAVEKAHTHTHIVGWFCLTSSRRSGSSSHPSGAWWPKRALGTVIAHLVGGYELLMLVAICCDTALCRFDANDKVGRPCGLSANVGPAVVIEGGVQTMCVA